MSEEGGKDIISVKDEVIALLDKLPDNATWDEVLNEIFHKAMPARSLQAAEAGDMFTQDEVEEMMRRWRASGGPDLR